MSDKPCSCLFPRLCEYLGVHLGRDRFKGPLSDWRTNRRGYRDAWKRGAKKRLEPEARLVGQVPATVKRWNCRHLGEIIERGPVGHCASKCIRKCAVHGQTTLTGCTTCKEFEASETTSTPPNRIAEPRPGDLACGVVVGCYKWPALAELQIRLIRDTCGAVPILISDDASPRKAAMRRLAEVYQGVTYMTARRRIGHAGGDLQAFRRGIPWAAGLGLTHLAKLSQRMLVTRPYWLQDGAAELHASGLPMGSAFCIEGGTRLPVRTELVTLDVAWWNRPEVLGRMPEDRRIGTACEVIVGAIASGSIMHNWSITGQDRRIPNSNYLWHTCNRTEDYRYLAKRYGVKLETDFSAAGWVKLPDHKWG